MVGRWHNGDRQYRTIQKPPPMGRVQNRRRPWSLRMTDQAGPCLTSTCPNSVVLPDSPCTFLSYAHEIIIDIDLQRDDTHFESNASPQPRNSAIGYPIMPLSRVFRSISSWRLRSPSVDENRLLLRDTLLDRGSVGSSRTVNACHRNVGTVTG